MTTEYRGYTTTTYVIQTAFSLFEQAAKKGKKPWEPSPKGQHGFPPNAMAASLVLKTMQGWSFDGLSAELGERPDLLEFMGLKRAPSRSALCYAAGRIDPKFLMWATAEIGRPYSHGSLVADSSGIATTVTSPCWLGVRYGIARRKDFVKLHAVIALNHIIVDCRITDSRRGDAPVFEEMCGNLPRGRGIIALDAAYLSKSICEEVEGTGRRPVICLKSNTRGRGYDSLGRMVSRQRRRPKEHAREYAKRGNVESMFHALKTAVSPVLRARKWATQKIELAMIALCYNIRRVAMV